MTDASDDAGCRWPLGDPATPGFRFCDAPIDPAPPRHAPHYCAAHAARATEARHAPKLTPKQADALARFVTWRESTPRPRRARDPDSPADLVEILR